VGGAVFSSGGGGGSGGGAAASGGAAAEEKKDEPEEEEEDEVSSPSLNILACFGCCTLQRVLYAKIQGEEMSMMISLLLSADKSCRLSRVKNVKARMYLLLRMMKL